MNVLFIMDKRVNAGSIHAVANHIKAGDDLGHTIALYGHADPRYDGVRFSTDIEFFDRVVFIIESGLRWMSGLRVPRVLEAVPRERRAILDADGMHNPLIVIDGYDRNFASEPERATWLRHYELLADRILQPTTDVRVSGVRAVPFYGYDLTRRARASSKRFDIVHVGHNWWRWREVSSCLLPAIERIRNQIGEVCFVGSWWDHVPAGAVDENREMAFGIDPERFRRSRIMVRQAVPYTDVITTMSDGRVNVMTQRPLFRHLKLLTSKYFEIFAADTIPLVMLDVERAEEVYGSAGPELALDGDVERKLLDALAKPEKYAELADVVRAHLATHHSYHRRVAELVEALA